MMTKRMIYSEGDSENLHIVRTGETGGRHTDRTRDRNRQRGFDQSERGRGRGRGGGGRLLFNVRENADTEAPKNGRRECRGWRAEPIRITQLITQTLAQQRTQFRTHPEGREAKTNG